MFRKTLFVFRPLTRKLWPWLFSLRCTSCKKKNWNEGQLRRAVTRHEIIINYMSHTYSESPGRALSHGATQFMSYICKKMSKSRFRDPSEQGFLRFSELGSPDYIVKSAIFSVWVFLMISVHGNTLYAIAIHKNRSITPFLTLWSHFENRTKKTLSILQLLRTCHISLNIWQGLRCCRKWGVFCQQNSDA